MITFLYQGDWGKVPRYLVKLYPEWNLHLNWLILSKTDCPPQCGWALSSWLKAWIKQLLTSLSKREFCNTLPLYFICNIFSFMCFALNAIYNLMNLQFITWFIFLKHNSILSFFYLKIVNGFLLLIVSVTFLPLLY